MGSGALGVRLGQIDVLHNIAPIADLAGQANTGARIHMANYRAVTFVAYMDAVSAGTDTFVIDLQEADAASAGNAQDLDVITEWYHKHEASLDGDEQWTRVTQSAASEVSLTGATFTGEILVVFTVDASQLSDGFEWLFVTIADPGTGGTRPGCVLAIGEPVNKRAPANWPQPNA